MDRYGPPVSTDQYTGIHRFAVGRRFILLWTPGDAVQAATDMLMRAGFRPDPLGYAAMLAREPSEWTTNAVQIGDPKQTKRSSIQRFFLEDSWLAPLLLTRRFRQEVSATLTVITARRLPDGKTELIVMPHETNKNFFDDVGGAMYQLTGAYTALTQTAQTSNAFVSEEQLHSFPKNSDCPASRSMIRKYLNWK